MSVPAMRELLKTIVGAYERRIEVFAQVMRETNQLLMGLTAKQEVLLAQLRQRLARARSLRRKDFDLMMEGARPKAGEEKDLLLPFLESLEKEGRALCEALKKAFRNPGAAGLGELQARSSQTLNRLEEKEREAIRMLRRAQLRQEELSAALKGLACKGEGLTIAEFRGVIKGLRLRRGAGEAEPGRILEDLEFAQEEANLRWARTLARNDARQAMRWQMTTKC